jgi:serine/threonine-protein kinase HipA
LNLEPQLKYDLSFSQIFETIRSECVNPLGDAKKLLHWIVFNGLIGNSDGHAKNLSLIHDRHGTRLAPFYDLVSTHCYKEFTRKMPIRIAGKKRDFRYLTKAHFTALAEEIQMKPAIVLKTVTDLSQKILTVSETAPIQFKAGYASIDVVDRIDTIVRHHAASMLDVLS